MHFTEAVSFGAHIWNPNLPALTYKAGKRQSDFTNNSDELVIYEDKVCFISDAFVLRKMAVK
jgi:hypothetical protein